MSTSLRNTSPAINPLMENRADDRISQRILLAKVGLDGHDRGIKVVARGLRDAGFHVIYGGIWQSPEAVAIAAQEEDADWCGLSLLNGAHMTLVPRVLDALRATGNHRTRVMLGGIIPENDITKLKKLGVAAVFGPGTSIASITEFLRKPVNDRSEKSVSQLMSAVGRGDRGALAQVLTRISLGRIDSDEFAGLKVAKKTIRTVVITGSAGVGKSSLIAAMLPRLVQQNKRVAVLACDPQSPLTGGALLGDRIRMASAEIAALQPQPLIRSLAVPSGRQGIAEHLDKLVLALDAFGFDIVLVESVGVGQGDVAAKQFADSVIVLLQSESGDSVQWEKAGLLEIADIVVVHKSDLPGAERLESELKEHLNMPGFPATPIVRVSAAQQNGLPQLCQYVIGGSLREQSKTEQHHG